MTVQIFVNLPVKDIQRSMEFFTELGFAFNSQFSDDTATCMVVSENVFVMLMTGARFKAFTGKQICDTTKSAEALVALSRTSRADVDAMVRKAVATGGVAYNDLQENDFMYCRGFQDPDGHIWELFFLEPDH